MKDLCDKIVILKILIQVNLDEIKRIKRKRNRTDDDFSMHLNCIEEKQEFRDEIQALEAELETEKLLAAA